MIHDYVKYERSATNRTILDEVLPATGGRVQADRVLFVARRASVQRVRFERHIVVSSGNLVRFTRQAEEWEGAVNTGRSDGLRAAEV